MMTEQVLTPQDVDRYWKAQVRAVDRWTWLKEHNYPMSDVEQAYEEMEQWGKLAEEIQEEYRQQYENQPCPHANVIHHIEPDGDIVICSDCGGWLDEDGKVYRYSPSLEETF
jgi:hypothetical protein